MDKNKLWEKITAYKDAELRYFDELAGGWIQADQLKAEKEVKKTKKALRKYIGLEEGN